MTLIILEGIDGSGKTTLAKRLAAQLHYNYKHFPHDVDTSYKGNVFYNAVYEDIVKHKPVDGENAVIDRYWGSSWAYNNPMRIFSKILQNIPTQGIYILCDISAATSIKRTSQRGTTDRFDTLGLEQKSQIIERYKMLHWDLVLDCEQPISDSYDSLLEFLSQQGVPIG